MSSIRKSIRRPSRCKIPRSCRAPSEVRATGGGVAAADGLAAAAGFDGVSRRGKRRAVSALGDNSPRNKMLKKQRNARTIRFKLQAPSFQDTLKTAPPCSPVVVRLAP